jgi:hypothetical protein
MMCAAPAGKLRVAAGTAAALPGQATASGKAGNLAGSPGDPSTREPHFCGSPKRDPALSTGRAIGDIMVG